MSDFEFRTELATVDNFDAECYLLANPDVRAWANAGGKAIDHLINHGLSEGRTQAIRGGVIDYAERRRRKYERFAPVLDPDRGAGGSFHFKGVHNSFPVVYGSGLHDLSEYLAESANNSFLPFTQEIESNPDKLYMDVGCGYRDRVHDNCLYVEVYHSRSADLITEPSCKYPIADESIDGIGCFAVLEHVTEPWVVAEEFNRILKPGGTIYIDWPFLQPVHGFPSHYYNATRSGLDRMFAGNFDKITIDTLDSQTPDYTLAWIIGGWCQSLTNEDVRLKFLGKTVKELVAEPAGSPFWRELIAATPAEARSTFACGNTLIARKRS